MSGDASSSTTATAATGGEAVVDVTVTSATTGGVAVTVTYAGTGGVDTVTSAAASSAGPSNAAADQAQVHTCTAYSCCSHVHASEPANQFPQLSAPPRTSAPHRVSHLSRGARQGWSRLRRRSGWRSDTG